VANMLANQVYEWCSLPPSKPAIGSKFTYKRKVNEKGEVVKWKARLVARGFEQRAGIDYVDTSAPVAGIAGFRILVCIALLMGWKTYSWDVDSAFLHPTLKEEIYMRPPSGYAVSGSVEFGKVLRLRKTIYGLKQAAAEWHLLLSGTFRELGYEAVDMSDCYWVKRDGKGGVCLACHHVDDCAVTSNSDKLAHELRDTLRKKYGLTDSGELKFHLGM
jgi:hypothetical protein